MWVFCRNLALFLGVGLLSSCAWFAPSEEAVEGSVDPQVWSKHRDQLRQLTDWQLAGKVGIKSAKDSGSGTLFWLQRGAYFDLRLSGPLGRGAARLTGRSGASVVLEVSEEGRFEADTPEELLESRMGWRLPVSHLFWWIRGIPVPEHPSRVRLNASGQLAGLDQDGWHVEYGSYVQQDELWLPERIKLEGPYLSITLVVKEWQLRLPKHP